MARRRKHVPLNVFLNSRFVGRLNREASGAIDFQYDPSWLGWEHAFPVSLSLPLREDHYVGAPVVAVFDNLLPDSDAIRRRVAERVGAEGADAYSLLTAVGRDCVGALQFLPDGQEPDPAGTIDGSPVDEDEIAQLLNNLASAPLGLEADQDFRISIAGAQEKTALLFWDGKWCKPHGTTATTHILKPQIGRIPNGIDLSDSIENEFLCLRLTAELGIPSAHVDIGDFAGKRALVVERFDRRWTRDSRLLRLPQEDCCQALSVPPTLKYQAEGGPGMREILDLLKGSDDPEADQSTFLRAAIVFWLLGATDGHAKNFSIFLNPGGRFRMTPLYDVLSAQPSLDDGQIQRKQMKLAMSAGDKRHYRIDDIMPRHFLQTAEKAGVGAPVVQPILEELRSSVPGAVERVVQSLPPEFPDQLVSSIVGGIEHRLSRIEA
jgi:serine/threonine-protein kinase HipA